MTQIPLHALVISDGRRGIQNQALGLAEALRRLRRCTIKIHDIKHSGRFATYPALWQYRLRKKPKHYGLPPRADITADIAIGCGRQAIAPLLALKRASPSLFTVYIQDPKIAPSRFDLVVAPKHDGLSGPNVLPMIGAPNRITAEKLRAAKGDIAGFTETWRGPRAAILIGGNSKRHHLTDPMCDAHIKAGENLLAQGYSLMVTTSRRTPQHAIERWQTLANTHSNIWLYRPDYKHSDFANPYFAFLETADVILVTQDSTNMLTEAAATGKPLFTLPMAGESGKFETLYKTLAARANMRAYDGNPAAKPYAPLNETEHAAKWVWQKFDGQTA